MDSTIVKIADSLTSAIREQYEVAIQMAPYVLGALALLVWGWILGVMAYRGVMSMSRSIKLDYFAEKVGLERFLKGKGSKVTSAHVIAKAVKGYIIFLFFVEAAEVARLNQIAEFLTDVIHYIPNVIVAIFIMLIGMQIGDTVSTVIRTSLNFTISNTANVLGMAAKYIVFVFAVLASLSQLEITPILINILFIGFVSMLTLAGGLAFGLGGKDVVKELLEAIKNVELIEYMENRQKKKNESS